MLGTENRYRPIGNEKIEPAVVIVIEPSGAEARIAEGCFEQTEFRRDVVELSP